MNVELTAAGPERPPERSTNRSVNNDRHAGSTAYHPWHFHDECQHEPDWKQQDATQPEVELTCGRDPKLLRLLFSSWNPNLS